MENTDSRFDIPHQYERKQPVCSFEDLDCWRLARELTNEIYRLTKDKQQFSNWSLANQIQRASVSVMSNLAEGFERGSREDQITFYYIAKASCGEVRCQLYIANDQNLINRSELDAVIVLCKRTSAAIYRFIESLKVSKYKGLRYKNNQAEEAQKQRAEFDQYLQNIINAGKTKT